MIRTFCLHDPYAKSPEVGVLQHALKNSNFYKGPIDNTFGPSTSRACHTAKWHLGYPKNEVNGCGGEILLEYLIGKRHLPPAYVVRRHARGYGLSKAEQLRMKICGHALWAVDHNPAIHYRQYRPMDMLYHPRALPWYTDCSEFVTTIYKWANGPDPNGMHFNGYGNTDSMASHGRTIPLWESKIADVVIWGTWNSSGWWTHHTAVIVDVTNHSDPFIVSHGSERGPLHLRLSQEDSAQHRQRIVKSYI